MAKKINPEQAGHFLRDVAPENCFWINYGAILKNLGELSGELKTMDQRSFRYHVNKKKNDFAKWIDEIVQDKTLVKELSKVKTQQSFLKKLDARIRYLKKIAAIKSVSNIRVPSGL